MSQRPLQQDVWLMRGIQSATGILHLSRGMLSLRCRSSGQLFGFQLRKLERQLAVPGLARRLDQDQETRLFAVPVSTCQFRWPWYYFSAGVVVSTGRCHLRLFFSPPRYDERGINSIFNALAGTPSGKKWRSAIDEVRRNESRKAAL